MDDISVETKNSEVVDMTGKVLSSTSTISMTMENRKMFRPDKTQSFLLQARSLYNSLRDVTPEANKAGMDKGESVLVDNEHRYLKVHYYSWGLFWTTLLKTFKDHPELKERNPELFENDETCEKCNGLGRIPYEVGGEKYEESYREIKEDEKTGFIKGDFQHGQEIASYCSPCQGVGFKYKRPTQS